MVSAKNSGAGVTRQKVSHEKTFRILPVAESTPLGFLSDIHSYERIKIVRR